MNKQIEVLMPYGESTESTELTGAPATPAARANRLKTLAGATIGVTWNGWHCMATIKDELRRILVDEFGAKEVIAVQTGTTMPMTPGQVADAKQHWHAAIVGLGT